MIKKHSKTAKLLAVFTLTATTLCMSGCSNLFEDETEAPSSNSNSSSTTRTATYPNSENYQDQELLDDNGNKYTLHKNSDGTETARYDDGKEVTFRRDETGNLSFVSGTAGLLAGMAAGYFLFHGFNPPAGSWNSATNKYSVSEPLKPASSSSRFNSMQKFTPAGGKIQDIKPPTPVYKDKEQNPSSTSTGAGRGSSSSSNVSKSSSNSGNNSSKSSVSSSKSGFGHAGARSSSS